MMSWVDLLVQFCCCNALADEVGAGQHGRAVLDNMARPGPQVCGCRSYLAQLWADIVIACTHRTKHDIVIK